MADQASSEITTKRHDRWAWEATVRIGRSAWVVAYGPTERSAIRRLKAKTPKAATCTSTDGAR